MSGQIKEQPSDTQQGKPRTGVLFFLCYLAALSGVVVLGTTIGLPSLPSMEEALGAAPGDGVYTLSLFQIGFAISPLFCGPLSDRFGRRALTIAGLGGVVFSSLGCALAPSFTVMLIFRTIQGVSSGFCMVMPMAIIRDLFTGDTARSYQGQVNAILGFAPMLAPFLGNAIYRFMGWRMVYVFLGAVSLLLILYAVFFMKESLPPDRRQSIAPRTIGRNYLTLLKQPVYMAASLTYIFPFAALFAFVSGSSLVFMQYFKVSSTAYSLIFILTSSSMMVGAFTSSALSRRGVTSFFQSNVAMGLVLFSACAIFFWPWLGAGSMLVIVAAAAVNESGFGLNAPNAIHEALTPVSGMVGAASGLMRSLQMGISALASLMVAALANGNADNAIPAVGTTMLLCAVLAVGFYVLLRWKRRIRL